MHELSLAKAIVENVTELAKREDAKRVSEITLVIGPLSGVVKESMEFCWGEAASGSLLSGSRLVIEQTELLVKCNDCGKETTPEVFDITCANCNSNQVKIVSGEEFILKNMEIE